MGKCGGVFGAGYGESDDFAAMFDEVFDLGETSLDVMGVDVGHALDGDGGATADGDGADVDGAGRCGGRGLTHAVWVGIHGQIVPQVVALA